MQNLLYTVTASLPPVEVDAYLQWLDGHIDEVIRAGAMDAKVIVYPPTDSETREVETQYTFADQRAFDEYEATHAPALRAEGRRLFGSKPGVTFARRLGAIHWHRGQLNP